MRVVITAAGPRGQARWNNHLGRPKHLVQVPPGGETLLRRTVRLVRELGVTDVVITGPEADPPGWSYETEGAQLFRKRNMATSDHDNFYREADRFLPREVWNTQGRTQFLAGDFYYCRRTLQGILDYDPGTWVLYARIRRTQWPKVPKGKSQALARTRMVLGFGFPAHEHDHVMASIEGLTAMQRDPNNPVRRSLGLDLYRYMCGQTPEELARTGGSSGKGTWESVPPHLWQPPRRSPDVDFDTPTTYETFLLHYKRRKHD